MIDLFNEAEKPFTGEVFTGPQTGLGQAAGLALPRGVVRLGQAATLAAAPFFPSESPEEFERKQALAPEERDNFFPTQEDFYRFSDERLEPIASKLTPDPASLTTAGQIVSALFELPGQLLAGPAGLIAAPALNTGRELVEQGVDPTTATLAGVGTGAAMGAAVALPAAGATLKQTLGLVAANPILGAAQDFATQELLQFRGYEEQSQMFDPFNPAARSVDLVLGAIFGGLHEYSRLRKQMPQQAVDAVDTVNLTKQREALSPFVAAHKKPSREAFEPAVAAMIDGAPVDVSRALAPLMPKPPEPSYNAERFRSDVKAAFGATDEQADVALALVAARAKVEKEDVDGYISRRIAGVEQGAPEAELLYQDRPTVQPFYSKVLAEVEGLRQEKWNGEQLLGTLRKTQGIKPEELAWTGLDEFLSGKKNVTREEVRGFLEENQVRLEEVEKKGFTGDGATKYGAYTIPGGKFYKEMLLRLPGKDYRSGHFSEPGILAHTRFNERTGPSGERILHLEEIQSDWHQAGRSKGCQADGGTVPDAPFAKTWHELALRRMLRYAAEHGFERLTWTTGEQQAARYDLSKTLNVVRYDAEGAGYKVTGQTKDGEYRQFGTYGEKQLEDAIGKDLARKMIAERKTGKEYAVFSGVDLKIGGEGMRGFYDKILPAYASKFGKKFGAQVETVDVDGHKLHSIKVTDAMRDSLLYEGQPLFQGEKGAVSFLADGRAVIHALQSPDFSTLLHELGHVFEKSLTPLERREFDTWLRSQVPGAKWSVGQQELFARAFERYLAEGKAPAPELQGVFDKLKDWLLEIYQRITGTAIDVKMPPQLKAAFDRMLFTKNMKTETPPDVARARNVVSAAGTEMLDELHRDLGVGQAEGLPLDVGKTMSGIEAIAGPDAAAGFLRSPENVSRVLADLFNAEAMALENSRAEQMAADGYALNAMVSDAAEWFLQRNRELGKSGEPMKKQSVVNALRKAATGDFSRLTAGQQDMVLAALDSLARQAQALVKEIDVQDLQVGDRFATPDLGQRVVVGERDGAVYLDNGQALDLADTVQMLGEIDRRGRAENTPETAAEYYLQERGDFDLYAGADSEGNPVMRSAKELIGEARAELAKAEAQEHLYKRAAFCLNLG